MPKDQNLLEIDSKLIEFAQNKLQVPFKNYQILLEALTHRSYLNETKGSELKHNERLEFLGDAVLELISTEYLYQHYPNRAEGELTSFRAALVRTESIAQASIDLGVGVYIYMSRGEGSTGGRKRPYILANTFEAILGAIYIDQGMETCKQYLQRVLLPKLQNIVDQRLDVDPKSKLREKAQEIFKVTPNYILVSEFGPDHEKLFTMAVNIGEMRFGEGSGHSKQEAEQQAASSALANWNDLYEKYQKSVKIGNS